MAHLPTIGLLTVADGRLMGDIDTVYDVLGYFVGRHLMTHELPMYAERARPLIVAQFPDMSRAEEGWEVVRDRAIALHGPAVEVPEAWKDALADGKDALTTFPEALERAKAQQGE